eukprot:TRINITY_DN59357_c0_g1_i1.p1 TRINITY_DN59357_c0_g1~~TRINITY_DN59357_c0_g1_i1.p1  ORF type:complete len:548 (-),score=74.97 TRINITY_DN59357_c0_g1_i1:190-1833(-)
MPPKSVELCDTELCLRYLASKFDSDWDRITQCFHQYLQFISTVEGAASPYGKLDPESFTPSILQQRWQFLLYKDTQPVAKPTTRTTTTAKPVQRPAIIKETHEEEEEYVEQPRTVTPPPEWGARLAEAVATAQDELPEDGPKPSGFSVLERSLKKEFQDICTGVVGNLPAIGDEEDDSDEEVPIFSSNHNWAEENPDTYFEEQTRTTTVTRTSPSSTSRTTITERTATVKPVKPVVPTDTTSTSAIPSLSGNPDRDRLTLAQAENLQTDSLPDDLLASLKDACKTERPFGRPSQTNSNEDEFDADDFMAAAVPTGGKGKRPTQEILADMDKLTSQFFESIAARKDQILRGDDSSSSSSAVQPIIDVERDLGGIDLDGLLAQIAGKQRSAEPQASGQEDTTELSSVAANTQALILNLAEQIGSTSAVLEVPTTSSPHGTTNGVSPTRRQIVIAEDDSDDEGSATPPQRQQPQQAFPEVQGRGRGGGRAGYTGGRSSASSDTRPPTQPASRPGRWDVVEYSSDEEDDNDTHRGPAGGRGGRGRGGHGGR